MEKSEYPLLICSLVATSRDAEVETDLGVLLGE